MAGWAAVSEWLGGRLGVDGLVDCWEWTAGSIIRSGRLGERLGVNNRVKNCEWTSYVDG